MQNILANMNPPQAEAIQYTEGPLLVLAGAGSGKTRVLTHRIAYLIREKGISPFQIMAITFTNKAAREMRERVDRIVGSGSESVWVSTFHSTCVHFLRRYIDRIGYDNHFSIYDTDDTKAVMKEVIRRLELDPKVYKERSLLARISSAKNEMITPEEMEKSTFRWEEKKVAQVYAEYQKRLKENNALDFDDLLLKTVELFRSCPDVLENYQERFRYIMVDEYQDTNTVQFLFVSLLAQKYRNLCVVGDDDQSIYKFRGANIQNILNFEKVFKNTKVIKLEQNYRSTDHILQAANGVIANNMGRKQKKLWTENPQGEKIHYRHLETAYDEADFVINDIRTKVREQGEEYKNFAILYRTNAQSRTFEEKCILANVPYRLVGGVNFYARREIKDLLAYLKIIDNAADDLSVKRIINVPKRGIGQTSLGRAENYAFDQNMSLFEALAMADQIPGLGRASAKMLGFVAFIYNLRENAAHMTVMEILNKVLEETGYVEQLEAEGTDEAKARIENINELITKAAEYDQSENAAGLDGFLQDVALIADIDSVEEDRDCLLMLTLHSAKGLEFDHVYMVGMEDNIFPSYMTLAAYNEEELEEERRLCYVGITRARKVLTMTSAQRRILRGETQFNRPSRFLSEIPEELLDEKGGSTHRRRSSEESGPTWRFGGDTGEQGYEDSISRLPFGSGGSYGSRQNTGAGSYGSTQSSGYGSSIAQGNTGTSGTHGSGRGKKTVTPPKVFQPKEFKVQKMTSLDYGVGDTVRHVKFGTGVVQKVEHGKKDFEVTVDFEKYGTKRMFASFAKLKKQ